MTRPDCNRWVVFPGRWRLPESCHKVGIASGGVPCLTLRQNTERPVTVSEGTNEVIGSSTERIIEASLAILAGKSKEGRTPELWDGHAAQRIVQAILDSWLGRA